MNYDICMRKECKNCYKLEKCFKEGNEYEFKKYKNSNIQSEKGSTTK